MIAGTWGVHPKHYRTESTKMYLNQSVNLDVTDEGQRATPTYTMKQGFFSFADMLPVKFSASMLQSDVITSMFKNKA